MHIGTKFLPKTFLLGLSKPENTGAYWWVIPVAEAAPNCRQPFVKNEEKNSTCTHITHICFVAATKNAFFSLLHAKYAEHSQSKSGSSSKKMLFRIYYLVSSLPFLIIK
jgi:hypothetical protein